MNLALVAEIYDEACEVGDAPTVAVAESFGLSRDVAAKKVQAARRAGLLPPTEKGKKGGNKERRFHCPTCCCR